MHYFNSLHVPLVDLQVNYKDTVWLSLNQITELFDRDKSVISRHISNIFRERELERSSVVAKNATIASDGNMIAFIVR